MPQRSRRSAASFNFRETPDSFPDVDTNVLPFASLGLPERCQRNGLGSQADRGHGAKAMGAGNDRVLAIETKCAPAVGGR